MAYRNEYAAPGTDSMCGEGVYGLDVEKLNAEWGMRNAMHMLEIRPVDEGLAMQITS